MRDIQDMDSVISRLILSVREALENSNWYAALAVVLILPDICSKIDGSFGQSTNERYPAWFEKYVIEIASVAGSHATVYDFFSAQDCYALRCAFLHEGDMEIVSQRAREYIHSFCFEVSTSTLWGITNLGERVTINLRLEHFCNDICKGVESWLNEKNQDKKVFDKLACLPKILISCKSE